MDAIVTHDLTKVYGGRAAVNHLNLRIPEGCVYGFLGRNGAGKSTTTRMLVGMAYPDAGSASVLGEDCTNLSPEMRGRIAYIAEGHPVYKWMTIQDFINFNRPFARQWNQALVDQILDHFELPRRKKLGRLSNGQRAQVSLAVAIAPDPDLLILDDPTLGLDTVVRRDFLESLIQIIQRRGRTILFSSHILGDVERVADRIGIMVDGVLRVDAPTDTFTASIRRLVLEFSGEPPAYPEAPGVIATRVLGRNREIIVANFTQEHHTLAAGLEPVALDVLELNLEDAFIAYTRGSRPPLPLFQTELEPRNGSEQILKTHG
jgi:ABC-2 type transport system ATP-binding protein